MVEKKEGESPLKISRPKIEPTTQEDIRELALDIIKDLILETSPSQWDKYPDATTFGEFFVKRIQAKCKAFDKDHKTNKIKVPNIPY